MCAVINCGQGTCKASNASFLGFDCECNSGWRKPQIGLFTFPYCVLPNGKNLSLCQFAYTNTHLQIVLYVLTVFNIYFDDNLLPYFDGFDLSPFSLILLIKIFKSY